MTFFLQVFTQVERGLAKMNMGLRHSIAGQEKTLKSYHSSSKLSSSIELK